VAVGTEHRGSSELRETVHDLWASHDDPSLGVSDRCGHEVRAWALVIRGREGTIPSGALSFVYPATAR
jgi:hypothetical protein